MKKYYVAYGSNLNKRQMKYRCPNAKPVCSGVLKDYELLFKGSMTGAYATVEPKEGSSVPVGLWEISKTDEKYLDRYEGYPTFYYKKIVDVHTERGIIPAMVYIMHEDRAIGQPSELYNEVCLEGYDDFGLNKLEYVEAVLTNMMKECAV